MVANQRLLEQLICLHLRAAKHKAPKIKMTWRQFAHNAEQCQRGLRSLRSISRRELPPMPSCLPPLPSPAGPPLPGRIISLLFSVQPAVKVYYDEL